MEMKFMKLKTFTKNDWPIISEIYQEGISGRNATFETSVPNWSAWDKSHHSFCRIAAWHDLELIGWTALSPISKRQVYSGVAEVSVYISSKFQNKGVGRKLLEQLIIESERHLIWMLQANILEENHASIALHKSCGFRTVGRRENIAQLDDVWRNVILMERRSSMIGV
jgi:phosphinothricin acetyltransferase